jgi:hypothetical protein
MQEGGEVKTSLGTSATTANLRQSASVSNLGSEYGDPMISARSTGTRRRNEEGFLNLDAKARTLHSARMHGGEHMKEAMSDSQTSVKRRSSMPTRSAWAKQDDSFRDDQSVTSTSMTCRSSVDLSHLGSGKFRGGLSPRSVLSPGRSPRGPLNESSAMSECMNSSAGDQSPMMRSRGEGVAITARGKSSSGIPWRKLPSYNEGGSIVSTGGVHSPISSPQPMKDKIMDSKKVASFSPVLAKSEGMREVLTDEKENPQTASCPQSPQKSLGASPLRTPESPSGSPQACASLSETPRFPGVSQAKAREAWLDLVQQRSSRSNVSLSPSISSPGLLRCGSPTNGSVAGGSVAGSMVSSAVMTASVASDGQPRQLHYAYRKQKQSPMSPTAREAGTPNQDTKDACPFHREDSIPESRMTLTPTRRVSVAARSPGSPQTPLAGVAEDSTVVRPDVPDSAERIADARRDYRYQQDKLAIEVGDRSPTPGNSMGNSRSASCDNLSLASYGANRMSPNGSRLSMSPGGSEKVHSIKARPPHQVAHRPRWR